MSDKEVGGRGHVQRGAPGSTLDQSFGVRGPKKKIKASWALALTAEFIFLGAAVTEFCDLEDIRNRGHINVSTKTLNIIALVASICGGCMEITGYCFRYFAYGRDGIPELKRATLVLSGVITFFTLGSIAGAATDLISKDKETSRWATIGAIICSIVNFYLGVTYRGCTYKQDRDEIHKLG